MGGVPYGMGRKPSLMANIPFYVPDSVPARDNEIEAAYIALANLVRQSGFDQGISPAKYRSLEEAASRLVEALAPHTTQGEVLSAIEQAIKTPGQEHSQVVEQKIQDLKALAQAKLEPDVYDDWQGPLVTRQWIIKDWLAEGRVALFTAEGGLGKSRFIVQLCAAAAAGVPDYLGGIPTVNGTRQALQSGPITTMIASWEDEYDEIKRRVRSLGTLGTGGTRSMGDRFKYVDMAGEGAIWAPLATMGHVSTVSGLTDAGARLKRTAEKAKAKILVLDPLAAAYASNENERGLVRAFVGDWDHWARENECAVIMVAHPSKSSPRYAGSTDWQAANRSVWTLSPHYRDGNASTGPLAASAEKAFVISVAKSNYGPLPEPVWIEQNGRGAWEEIEQPDWVT